jgi:hypothetical protein
MDTLFSKAWAMFTACTMFTACALPGIPFVSPREQTILALPQLPQAWQEVLGPPRWRLEWFGPQGTLERTDLTLGADSFSVDLAQGIQTPLLAYPWWPDRGLPPGVFRPAGAIYPHGVRDSRLGLSWEGGVSAWFYRELALADGESRTRPEGFDWPRFSTLIKDPIIPETLRQDPWRVDWTLSSRRIRASGFDRRRLVPRERLSVSIGAPADGPWIAASPFMPKVEPTLSPSMENRLLIFIPKSDRDWETYVSPSGLIRCSGGHWAYFPLADPPAIR